MKYLLIMNPGSRSGKGRSTWNTWISLLNEKKADFSVATTNSIEHTTELARDALDFNTIVAVGGDGTINRVVTGVLSSPNPHRNVGILYSGTSPDFCKFHKIPLTPELALEALLSGKNKDVDVAKITYQSVAHGTETAFFTCSCNIGMGATIARKANRWRRYLGDVCGTGAASLCAIVNGAKIDLNIKHDNKSIMIEKANNFSVIINPYLASGLKLNLEKKSDDGQLILFALKNRNICALIKDLPKFYTGSIISEKDVFLGKCKKIIISSNQKQEIEFDGDPRGFLPITIEIQMKKLKLVGSEYA